MATLKFASPEIRVGLDSAKSNLIKIKNEPKITKDKKRIVKTKPKNKKKK